MRSTSIFTSLLLAALSSTVIATPAIGDGDAPVIRNPVVSVAPASTIDNGRCGKANGNICSSGCCSASGTCGTTMGHCGEGCQLDYGTCGMANVDKFPAGAPADTLIKNFKHGGKMKGKGLGNGTRPARHTGTRPSFLDGTPPPRPNGGSGGPGGPPPSGPPPSGLPPTGPPPSGLPPTGPPPSGLPPTGPPPSGLSPTEAPPSDPVPTDST